MQKGEVDVLYLCIKLLLQNVTIDSEIIMRRKEDGKTIQFKVVDNVSKLNRED
jgi:hypothetical protein